MGIRIGIDVGERSVGLAAIDYDDDGWPIEILAAVSHIHDGGMDPDTAKSPRSRLATAGVARRTRRLLRNRRRRLKKLDDVLLARGIPIPDGELTQTHEAWHARAALSEGYVQDETFRAELLSLALRHMARHRGWRNPWWSYRRLAEEPTPSKALTETIAKAQERFGIEMVGNPATMGQLVSRVVNTQAAIRPIKGALDGSTGPVMAAQVQQQDTLAEARLILQVQKIAPSDTDEICQALMYATEPTIPKERIGRCDLLPDLPRATTATLEYQEYRIRDAVANLRIGSEARQLTADEYDRAVDFLLGWREDDSPRWREVAEVLGVSPRQLKQPSIDQGGGSKAPTDRTSINLEAKANKKSPLGMWWRDADRQTQADLIDFMTDLSGANEDPENPDLAQFLKESGDTTFELMEKVKLASGRASYSREALRRILDVMRVERCNAHGARTAAFNLPDDWAPTPPSFLDDIEHPTVSRINSLVYRFLTTTTQKWGVPEAVMIEHVRESFMGPTALAELESEIRFNTSRRDKIKEELASQGVVRPTNTDVRRFESIQRQQGMCLYCGSAIEMNSSELDHIVPKAGGGSNRVDNLVATCRPCNAAKGKLPFAAWATKSSRPGVSVEEATTRVKAWKDPRRNAKQLKRLQRDVQHRLTLTEDDEPIDERSLGSTAYAARQMRARTQSFLVAHGGSPDQVYAYAGAITSEARKAGGFSDVILLRDKRTKTRFDRRHHAIDAAVLTSLRPSIAHSLLTRTRLRIDEQTTIRRDDPERKERETWRDFRGASAGDVVLFEEWKQRAGVLAELLRERITTNRVPVVRPLRLSPRIGSIHADTVEPLVHKDITEAFTATEIRRVINTPLFKALRAESGGADLLEDADRAETVGWDPKRLVDLYPSSAAYLPVRGGAVAIGGSAKFARVYAWETKKGFAFGMVRIFAGEFGRLGFLKPGIDLFTVDLPLWSQAMRNAPPALVERIENGEAKQIGWLTINDEIELDPAVWVDYGGKIGALMKATAEENWTLSGFFSDFQLSIVPAHLAHEGVDEKTPPAVAKILKDNRIPTATNALLGAPGTTIIRRTILGTPRWQDNGLPTSWKPQEAAAIAFGS